MDMKMFLCAILILAASMTSTMAYDAPAPAPAPGDALSESAATMPVAGSLVGLFLLSFLGILFK